MTLKEKVKEYVMKSIQGNYFNSEDEIDRIADEIVILVAHHLEGIQLSLPLKTDGS